MMMAIKLLMLIVWRHLATSC